MPPRNLEYADYMVSIELLFRDIKTTNLSNIQNETIKSKLRDTAFSSLTSFDKNKPKNNLTKAELHALNSLKQNNDIIIQKADKGNTVVIIGKDAYRAKMKSLISDPSKFKKLDIQNDKQLNFILDKERKLKDILKPLYIEVVLLKVSTLRFVHQDPNQAFFMDKLKFINQLKIISHLYFRSYQQLAHQRMT